LRGCEKWVKVNSGYGEGAGRSGKIVIEETVRQCSSRREAAVPMGLPSLSLRGWVGRKKYHRGLFRNGTSPSLGLKV
jgi:hypothetical protein